MKIDLKIFITYFILFLISHVASNFIFGDGINTIYTFLDLIVYSVLYVSGSVLLTLMEQKSSRVKIEKE